MIVFLNKCIQKIVRFLEHLLNQAKVCIVVHTYLSITFTDVHNKQFRDTNSLVEEFMLLANISVAKKLYDHFPQHAVLRKHPVPSTSMFESLIKAAASQVCSIF